MGMVKAEQPSSENEKSKLKYPKNTNQKNVKSNPKKCKNEKCNIGNK